MIIWAHGIDGGAEVVTDSLAFVAPEDWNGNWAGKLAQVVEICKPVSDDAEPVIWVRRVEDNATGFVFAEDLPGQLAALVLEYGAPCLEGVQ